MRPLARGAIDPRQRSLDQAARKVEIIGRAPLVRGSRSRSTRQTAAQALEPHLLPQKLTSIAAGFAAAGLRQPPSRARCLAVRITSWLIVGWRCARNAVHKNDGQTKLFSEPLHPGRAPRSQASGAVESCSI